MRSATHSTYAYGLLIYSGFMPDVRLLAFRNGALYRSRTLDILPVIFAFLLCPNPAAPYAESGAVRVWQDTTDIPTYRETDPDVNPPFDQLQPNGPFFNYPYTMRLGFTKDKSSQPWRVLNLENEYLHCRILPDLGGHLYNCVDKLSGAEMFYANSSVRKAWIAPRGAWVSMGIETSFPIAHSRVTVSPVHFAAKRNPDGSGSIWIGAVDRVSGMEWRVAYTLRPGRAVLEQKVWLYNRGAVRHPYDWWTNAAVRLDGGLRFTYPMAVVEQHGSGDVDTWPVNTKGVDMSTTSSHPDMVGLFAIGSHEPFFAAYNPKTQMGVAHWADPKEVPGKKLWSWGTRGNDEVRATLSDDGSSYVEIQAGVLQTQEEFEFLDPQQTKSFTEYWIPVRKMSGVSRVSLAAVAYLERKADGNAGSHAVLEINVTEPIAKAMLTISSGETVLYTQKADLDPAVTFRAETSPSPSKAAYHFELKDPAGHVLLSHTENSYDAVSPSQVRLGPKQTPSGKRVGENDFLAAGALDELKLYRDSALGEYRAGLTRFPQSLELRKSVARAALNINRFTDAAELLSPLKNGGTTDPEVLYYLGVAKAGAGDDAGARKDWELVATGSGFRGPAQFQLAGALARTGERQAAIQTLHTLTESRDLVRAGGLEVALLRLGGQPENAAKALDRWLSLSPLDPLLRLEAMQLGREDKDLWAHLAADPEWILDAVDDYFHIGSYEDSIALLGRTYPAVPPLQTEPGTTLPQANPLIAYYRGYARKKLGQPSSEDFRSASGMSTRYVFPHRASSFAVLREAVAQDPRDATAHYLLGCLYLDSRMTDEAIAEWNQAKAGAARIPAFYPTFARVLSDLKKDPADARTLLKEAIAKDPNNIDLRKLLEPSSQSGGAPVPSSFSTPEEAAAFALALAAKGQLSEAHSVFQQKTFPKEKQSAQVREAYVEVQLQRVLAMARAGQCTDASPILEDFVPEDKALTFTMYSFGSAVKAPRIQFYLGLAETICKNEKAARKRWSKVAKASAPLTSPDYAFPLLADFLLNPPEARTKLETSVESVRAGAGSDKAIRLYSQGMLLRAMGQDEQARMLFEQGAQLSSGMVQYLNTAALREPRLPQ